MIRHIEDRLQELEIICEKEHNRIYNEHGCKIHCGCVYSQEDIERFVELTKEPSYTLPRGLSREERRKWISEIGSNLSTKS